MRLSDLLETRTGKAIAEVKKMGLLNRQRAGENSNLLLEQAVILEKSGASPQHVDKIVEAAKAFQDIAVDP